MGHNLKESYLLTKAIKFPNTVKLYTVFKDSLIYVNSILLKDRTEY